MEGGDMLLSLINILVGATVFGCSSANPKDKNIREPAVAGQWYPADKKELQTMVQGFLDKVDPKEMLNQVQHDRRVCGLIAPHAGFVFSGQTAAYAFKQLEGRKYKDVILLGASHCMHFRGASVFKNGMFKTPLGLVEINDKLAKKIMDEDTTLFPCSDSIISSAHTDEHSLEAEIPFLQMVLPDFKIVPIIMSEVTPEMCEKIASAILKHVGDRNDVLIVCSSDMSHYPSYNDACKVDSLTLSAIASMDSKKVLETSYESMSKGIPNLHCTLCAEFSVITTMLICKGMEANKAKILKYMNSGDTPIGEKDRVVGYGAVAFYKDATPVPCIRETGKTGKIEYQSLDSKAQNELLKIARKTIENYARNRKIPQAKPSLPIFEEKRGVFVTLTEKGELRGCIGHHEADTPLYKIVSEMAIASAFQDYRFPPVREEELKDIKIKISVYLTNVYEIKSIEEYQLGEDGIILSKGGRSATFLPEVPIEQNWTKEQTLTQLSRKAGLPPDAWKEGARFYVYKTQVFGE